MAETTRLDAIRERLELIRIFGIDPDQWPAVYAEDIQPLLDVGEAAQALLVALQATSSTHQMMASIIDSWARQWEFAPEQVAVWEPEYLQLRSALQALAASLEPSSALPSSDALGDLR